ncbi:MAG: LytTR family transcriptional regulator DNA-binding domain-containing protein [Bacteroidota bacterium]
MVTLLVDGEPYSHNVISTFCQESPDIQFFIAASSIEEGLQHISNYHPQLVFLGSNLPDGSPHDLIDKSSHTFEKIFLYDADSFSTLPYRPEVLAYLLQPVSQVAFEKSIRKAKNKLSRINNLETQLMDLSSRVGELEERKLPHYFSISNTEGILFRKVDNIICLNAQKNYTEFVMDNSDTPLIASSNLGAYETLFSSYPNMKKIHRSHIVNLHHASAFLRKDGGYLIMKKGMKLKVSKHLRQDVLNSMKEL